MVVLVLGDWLTGAQTVAGMWAMRLTGRETFEVSTRFAVAAVAVLLLPTMLLGAAFPAVSRLTARASAAGRGIGTTLAVNTVGGIVGTLLTGLVLVPQLGLVRSLGLLAVAAATIGAVALTKGGQSRTSAAALVTAVAVAATLAEHNRNVARWRRLLRDQKVDG